jgi:phosphoenolpyruvate synthase/pyruvate phosphate dikinase
MTSIVLPLSDPDAQLALVGGKGASLARLSAAGLPVPVGFHVTTAAYKAFVNRCRNCPPAVTPTAVTWRCRLTPH